VANRFFSVCLFVCLSGVAGVGVGGSAHGP